MALHEQFSIHFRRQLSEIQHSGRLRQLRDVTLLPGGWMEVNGKRVLNLSGNDYLGMAADLSDEHQSMEREWTGATASQLVVGHSPVMHALEDQLADLKGTEAAVIFGSGYLANLGIFQALADRQTWIFSDRFNHASIVDGIVLSRARHQRYQHNDLVHLAELLEKAPADAMKLIVTDAVFSMDGDLADLPGLVALKEKYGALLIIDEAHSGGVFGERGEGLAHAHGMAAQVDVLMGTFSKAYGVYGAYVATSRLLADMLINRARSLIYTTALPPMVLHAISRSVAMVSEQNWRRERLWANIKLFKAGLRHTGLDIGVSDSAILPVIIGDDAKAVDLSDTLLHRGICGVAIRPPTVPEGTARIRFSLSAAHQQSDLEQAVSTLQRVCGLS